MHQTGWTNLIWSESNGSGRTMCSGNDCKICSYLTRIGISVPFRRWGTNRFSSSVIILLRLLMAFIAFSPSEAFLMARRQFLALSLPWTQWWHFDMLLAVQLLIHDCKSTQMMSWKHFANNYLQYHIKFLRNKFNNLRCYFSQTPNSTKFQMNEKLVCKDFYTAFLCF